MSKLCEDDPTFQIFENFIDLRFSAGKDAGKSFFPVSLALKGSVIVGMEAICELRNCQKFYLLLNSTSLKITNGEILGCLVTLTDITKRKLAEEKIRLSNIYNRSLIEASLDPLVTIGHDGKITDVNTSTELVTGHSRDELTDVTNYFTDPDKAQKGHQEVFREGFVSDYALEIKHRDGSITPVLYNASIYRDECGKVLGVFAAARDISECKRMEAELESIARLPQENPNPVIRLNQGYKINYSNPCCPNVVYGLGLCHQPRSSYSNHETSYCGLE